jgi:hypothetical protein
MKLWIDDIRPAPEGYLRVFTTNQAKRAIEYFEKRDGIELIDMDHDAGDLARSGCNYIRILDWLEETGRNYPIRIHSTDPVEVANMRRIIQKNGWKEVF